jgi:DMSO reductase family type II enzyme heme b subunit
MRFVLIAILALLVGIAGCGGDGEDESVGTGNASNGKAVYMKRCAQCHGDKGEGDGPAAGTMLPRPRIFKGNKFYKFKTTPTGKLPTDRDLYNVITKGIPGTSMPGFETLPDQERWDLVAFIKTMSPDFSDPDEIKEAKKMDVFREDPPELSDEEKKEWIEAGRKLFTDKKNTTTQCFSCHGPSGRGNGPDWAVKFDNWNDVVGKQAGSKPSKPEERGKTPIVPANLSNPELLRNGRAAKDIFRTITTGIGGTPMASYEETVSKEERWKLAYYIESLGPAKKEKRDDKVVAVRVDAVPTAADDKAWEKAPVARFKTAPNIIEPPRLFWPSVAFVNVQAVYSSDELALRIQWDDRSESKGTDTTKKYNDRDHTIYVQGTGHPDQFDVQFPVKTDKTDTERPYFLMGDRKRPVNLWSWRGDTGKVIERNAKGFAKQSIQPPKSQDLQGGVTFDDGRYTMIVSRSLKTGDALNDVQFEVGKFVPMAFSVWDGDRGELGQRRALTTWYWVYLKPAETDTPKYVGGIVGVVAFVLLFAVGFLVRRKEGAGEEGKPEDETASDSEAEEAEPEAAAEESEPEAEEPEAEAKTDETDSESSDD